MYRNKLFLFMNFSEILPQNRPPRSLDWYDHIASSQLASNTREPSPRQLRRLEQRRLEKQKKAEQADYEERKANLGPYDESRDAEFDKCMEERVPEDKPMNDYSAYRSCVDEHLRRIRLRKWKVYKEKQKARELWEKQHPTFLQWLWERLSFIYFYAQFSINSVE